MLIRIKKLCEEAVIPAKGTLLSAGYDLIATKDPEINDEKNTFTYNTGIALEIPPGYGGFIYPRSSIIKYKNFILANSVGVIDSDYRGEILVVYKYLGEIDSNTSIESNFPKAGDKIAQLIIHPTMSVHFELCTALSETSRGSGGFGSTDVSIDFLV